MAQQQLTPAPPAQAYLPTYTSTPINGGIIDNEEKEIVKLKITSKSISASGEDCDDVAQVVLKKMQLSQLNCYMLMMTKLWSIRQTSSLILTVM